MLNWFHRHKEQPTTVIVISETIIEVEGHQYHHHKHRFKAYFSINIKNSKFLIMALTLNQGQTDVVGIQVIDSITNNVLDKAVLSAQTYAVADSTIVGATPDTDATKEDLVASAGGTTNLDGTITADLSAYGLGTAVVLQVQTAPITVVPAVTVTPQAVFVFAPPVTPAPATT